MQAAKTFISICTRMQRNRRLLCWFISTVERGFAAKSLKATEAFRAWISAGFSIVTVEYRLTGDATAPAAVEDVRCSLAWVKSNAPIHHLDANRVVVYGTSAGGHLALMAGMLPAGNDN